MGLVLKLEQKSRTFLDISQKMHPVFVEKTESAFFVFCLYLCEKRVYFKRVYYQNDQAKNSLQTLKVSTNLDVVVG